MIPYKRVTCLDGALILMTCSRCDRCMRTMMEADAFKFCWNCGVMFVGPEPKPGPTNGEWEVSGPSLDITADGNLIAATRYLGNSTRSKEEHLANARIMAASKKLLAALKGLMADHDSVSWDAAKAAIAYAEPPTK